ncbi:MAG: hypothetical protein ACRCUJ_02945, partial [Phocaeicola sp.]
ASQISVAFVVSTQSAAFGYETMNRRRVFQKVSDTHYRLPKRAKLVSYRSLHTLEKAIQNESV